MLRQEGLQHCMWVMNCPSMHLPSICAYLAHHHAAGAEVARRHQLLVQLLGQRLARLVVLRKAE